jgi:hypothetical protein
VCRRKKGEGGDAGGRGKEDSFVKFERKAKGGSKIGDAVKKEFQIIIRKDNLAIIHVGEDVADATTAIVSTVAVFTSDFSSSTEFFVKGKEEFMKYETGEKDAKGAALGGTIFVGEKFPDAVWVLIPAFGRVTIKKVEDGEMLGEFLFENFANFLAGNGIKHIALIEKKAYTCRRFGEELVRSS